MTNTTKTLKKSTLRYNEYYDMQSCFDDLYIKSKQGKTFKKLYDIIIDEKNIKLAYRNIKSNTGSNTQGVDGLTVKDYSNLDEDTVVKIVRNSLNDYKPDKVRRVEIPKPNGKVRPLGIPTFRDRLIQQCFKQVLEPICEAKFHNHSYGFRPNRSAEHALSRMGFLMNRSTFHYCVDIDIKGFFDNINHGKLLKQLWSMGICDKKVISIISKMLKAEIKGIGKPTKGTPQGGILSPLLANVVLNEFDWWISSQWETHPTKTKILYKNRYRTLKTSNLKEVFIVRYADDFKLMCKDYETANKIYIASKNWLQERLGLEISEEKSKITNLRKSNSEFLGFKLKVTKKVKLDKHKNKKHIYSLESHICDKAKENIKKKILKRIKDLQKSQTRTNVALYNSSILGMHNYYRYATHVSKDFASIGFHLRKTIYNRLQKHMKKSSITNQNSTAYKYYGGYKGQIYSLSQVIIYPISYIQNDHPLGFSQEKCDYTEIGREMLHKNLDCFISSNILYLLKNPIRNTTIEYNDNRISKYSSQKGLCAITNVFMEPYDMECHHKMPKKLGGTDKFNNLICITKDVHKLIHATNDKTINKYLTKLKINKEMLTKINKYRVKVGNEIIKL